MLEVSAEKPGNITPSHDFDDTTYEDMLRCAIAIGPELVVDRGVGETVLAVVEASRRVAPANTNLGIALLLAPLAKAALAGGPLRERLGETLRALDVADARAAYAAIRLAGAGGLDEPVEHDVRAEPAIGLREAMAAAAERDSIASEYVTDFALTFEVGLPALRNLHARRDRRAAPAAAGPHARHADRSQGRRRRRGAGVGGRARGPRRAPDAAELRRLAAHGGQQAEPGDDRRPRDGDPLRRAGRGYPRAVAPLLLIALSARMLADLAGRDDVIAFDLFGDLDLRADRVVKRRSLTALVDAAMEEEPGDVIYGASFENHPKLVERLAERHTLLGNPPEVLRAVRDPARLAAVLGDSYARSTFTPPSSGRWLRKPLRGGGGIRVREWRGGALPAGTFLQERIDGVPCSVAAIGDGKDAVVLGLSEQLVGLRAFGVRGYRWCGNLVPPRVPVPLDQPQAICSRLAAAFGLRGPFGVDFIWDGERAWVVEVNPRPTASLEVIKPARAAGKAVVFATEDVVVGELAPGVRDVPHPGERIAKGRPICTVVSTAATPDEVLAGLEEQAAALLEVAVCG